MQNSYERIQGTDENALTKSWALLLEFNKNALREILRQINLGGLRESTVKDIEIRTQVSHGKYGRTDIELSLEGRFLTIIEAKLDLRPDENQLKRYATFLRKRKDYPEIRLVLLTRRNEESFYNVCFKRSHFYGLSKKEFIYINWEYILNLLGKILLESQDAREKDFWNYLWRMNMGDEIVIFPEDDPAKFELFKKEHIFYNPKTKVMPMYIAIYTVGKDYDPKIRDKICYIAKVESVGKTSAKKLKSQYGKFTKKNIPQLPQYRLFRTGKFIKLPRPIEKRRTSVRARGKKTTFEKLLAARYTDEL